MIIANRASTILFQYLKDISFNKGEFFLIPSNICIEVLYVFIKAKVPFRFIDINKKHNDLDLKTINSEDRKIKGLLYNHIYGNEFTPEIEFFRFKNNNPNFIIIDDRCLCEPQLDFTPNPIIDLTLFSTGAKKQVDMGMFGFAYCNDPCFQLSYKNTVISTDITKQAIFHLKNLKYDNYSEKFKKLIESDWLDERIPNISEDEYKAAILIHKEEQFEIKQKLIQLYSEEIPINLQYSREFQNWRFNVLCKNSDEVLNNLFAADLFASKHYFPISAYYSTPTINANWMYNYTINLFIDHYFDEEKARKASHIINNVARSL